MERSRARANGTAIHGFSGIGRQHTKRDAAAARAARGAGSRTRAPGSAKNITPKRERHASHAPGVERVRLRVGVREARRSRALRARALRARARASRAETSTPSTRPRRPDAPRERRAWSRRSRSRRRSRARRRRAPRARSRRAPSGSISRVDALLLRDPLLAPAPSSSTRSAPRWDRTPRSASSALLMDFARLRLAARSLLLGDRSATRRAGSGARCSARERLGSSSATTAPPRSARGGDVCCWQSIELEAPAHELAHQHDERDLRRVGLAREHRLAEEDAAERHAVEPADQAVVRDTPRPSARTRARCSAQ